MSNFRKLVEENPGKYPARLGAPWSEEECTKLLQSIKNNKSIEDIAKEHGRSAGGITARLRHLAVEYYNKHYEFDDIEELTGLSQDIIADAIARHSSSKERSKEKNKEKTIKEFFTQTSTIDSNAVIITTLKEIKTSIDKLINLLEKK